MLFVPFIMKVKELIKLLESMPQEASVVIEQGNNDGCDTCGYGETCTDYPIAGATDLDTRVVLRI